MDEVLAVFSFTDPGINGILQEKHQMKTASFHRARPHRIFSGNPKEFRSEKQPTSLNY